VDPAEVAALLIHGEERVGLVLENITTQKQLEQKLVESEKRSTVNQLAGGIDFDGGLATHSQPGTLWAPKNLLWASGSPGSPQAVTITNSYETAIAISKGELNTQMAFMTGKIKVAGNMTKLITNQAMLSQFANASAGMQVEY
jgi:putative sterol carrier protein